MQEKSQWEIVKMRKNLLNFIETECKNEESMG